MPGIAALEYGQIGHVHAACASPDFDAVPVAASTPTHADLIGQAVAAGKPLPRGRPIDLGLARVVPGERATSVRAVQANGIG